MQVPHHDHHLRHDVFQQTVHSAFQDAREGNSGVMLRPLSAIASFDEQLQDSENFALSDNQLGALTALLTSVSIVLITDILLRVVVRARGTETSSFGVYRRALLLRAASPIEWLALILQLGRRRGAKKQKQDQAPVAEDGADGKDGRTFPTWQRPLIIAVGLCIVAIDLLLIFFATNRSVPVHLDPAQMPSFALKDWGRRTIQTNLFFPCVAERLTAKPGFTSLGRTQVCAYHSSSHYDKKLQLGSMAVVRFMVALHALTVTVWTNGLQSTFQMHVIVSIPNSTQYVTLPDIRASEVAPVLRPAFERWNVSVLDVRVNDSSSGQEFPGWVMRMDVDISRLTAPPGALDYLNKVWSLTDFEPDDNDAKSLLQNLIVHAIARAPLVLTGRSRAYGPNFVDGITLDQYEGHLVEKERPWLSVVASIVIASICLVTWIVVSVGLRWSGGVEEWAVWLHVFQTIHAQSDFRTKENELVSFS